MQQAPLATPSGVNVHILFTIITTVVVIFIVALTIANSVLDSLFCVLQLLDPIIVALVSIISMLLSSFALPTNLHVNQYHINSVLRCSCKTVRTNLGEDT